ncbi:MAG: hypothetical protein AAF591_11965 [Verrucomicrobiota bacterium]
MLAFVTPLKAPEVCQDWERMSALCDRTLRSIAAQTSDRFKHIVVCSKKPDTDFTHPNLTFIEEPFPVPETREDQMADKYVKVRRGMVAARDLNPTHLMLVDADDVISNKLAAFVDNNPHSNGWSFHSGYLHDENTRWLMRINDFALRCGTCTIARIEDGDLPESVDEPREKYWWLSTEHNQRERYLNERGRSLSPLPFPGSIYIIGSGENWGGFSLKGWRSKKVFLQKMIQYRPVTSRIRREFGLTPLNP